MSQKSIYTQGDSECQNQMSKLSSKEVCSLELYGCLGKIYKTMLVTEKSKGSSEDRGFEVFYSSFPNLGKKIKLLFVGFSP